MRARAWNVLALGAALAAGAACTQDFDQFTPDGSGGTGNAGGAPTGGGGTGGGGAPVGCMVDADCEDNNPCTDDICGASGTCTNMNVPDGLAPGYNDVASDCVEDRCDAGVFSADVADDTEVPNDMNDCTVDSCSGGTPTNANEPEGTMCGDAGLGLTCNDAGQCTGCMTPTDCGMDTECVTFTCDANMVCGTSFTAVGTPVAMQTAGDCRTNACDGAGGTVLQVNNADVPVDGDPCTSDVCTAGTPSNPNAPNGTTCATGVCLTGGCVECIMPTDCTLPDNTCMNNTCSCVDATACSGMACGMVTDACGQTQNCGTTNCGPMQVCNMNLCCTPIDPCGPNACGEVESDGCGGTVDCAVTYTCPAATPMCNNGQNMCQ